MIKTRLSLMAIVILAISFGASVFLIGQGATAWAMTMDQEYEGYLLTANSSSKHNNPAEVTKACLQKPNCAVSGYGVSVKNGDGKYQFYKFDENGQKLVKEILAKTTKENGIVVIATGTLEGQTLKVTTLREKVLQKPVTLTLTGWLIDKCCSGNANPAKHTRQCNLMKCCAASGYGIIIKQADGSFKFYKFDAKGHNLADAYIKKTTKNADITITVQGIWDGELLQVTGLAEK